jgi:hypothetical protein
MNSSPRCLENSFNKRVIDNSTEGRLFGKGNDGLLRGNASRTFENTDCRKNGWIQNSRPSSFRGLTMLIESKFLIFQSKRRCADHATENSAKRDPQKEMKDPIGRRE